MNNNQQTDNKDKITLDQFVNEKEKDIRYSKNWLSKSEIERLFEAPGIKTRDLILMKLCYLGALRVGEAINAKYEDFGYEDEYTFLILRTQKTDKRNWEKQPIPKSLYSEIIRYCEDKEIKLQEYIFPTRQSKQMTYLRAYQIVKDCVEKAGIKKDINTHAFRRSRATHLLDGGADPYTVQDFLRHKSFETTRKYLKISKKRLFDKMEEIDKKTIFKIL